MRTVVLLILLSVFTQGCVTQKACFNKFPPVIGVTDTVLYRDTVYYFRTFSDTVWARAGIMDTVNASSGMIIGKAWVVHDSIYLKVIQRDTVIAWRDSVRTEIKKITKVIQQPCAKTPVLNKIVWIVALILAGGVLIFIKSILR